MSSVGGSKLGASSLPPFKIAGPILDPNVRRREEWFAKPIIAAFRACSVRPSLGLALARHESMFSAKACALQGGDARRGGSFGIMQMSMATARQLKYNGTYEGLFQVKTCAQLAAKLCEQNQRRVFISVTRDPDNVLWAVNMASLYNSGHLYKDCPRSTREVYVPKVVSYFLYYQHVLGLGENLKA